MAATVKDVARLAGVSTATVSRVINNDSRISSATREKVLKCMAELDYKLNGIARSLKTNKSYTIGFLCPELTNTFFMAVAKGVEDELKKYGYSVLICNSNESVTVERERVELLMEKCVDGLIVIPASSEGAHLTRLREKGMPVVLVDRLVEDFSTDAVLVDNINGSYAAIEHLIGEGYRRIGYIGGDERLTSARERDEGYRRAHMDYRIPIEEEIVKRGDFHAESGYRKMKELMELENPPEYVFITNYYMHAGAAKYLMENENCLKKPVFIASFDDIELASLLGFCRLLVGQPMIEIGSRAARLILSRINGEALSYPQVVRLKTNLIFNQAGGRQQNFPV